MARTPRGRAARILSQLLGAYVREQNAQMVNQFRALSDMIGNYTVVKVKGYTTQFGIRRALGQAGNAVFLAARR